MPIAEGYANDTSDLTEFLRSQNKDLLTEEIFQKSKTRIASSRAFADVKPPEVGDKTIFNSYNRHKESYEKVSATLKRIGKHCYVYLEDGQQVSDEAIDKLVSEFDNTIYVTSHKWFGSEASPGIDNDERITLLLLDIKDIYTQHPEKKIFINGYFSIVDCHSKDIKPNSNEREMLYIDIYPAKLGSNDSISNLAHEFQHMIHYNQDPNEYTWVDESLSQLSPYLCGYGHQSQVNGFAKKPDNSIVAWSQDTIIANYGIAYLLAQYLYSHIADTEEAQQEFIRTLVAQRKQGIAGLDSALKALNIKTNFRDLFRRFTVANYLNDPRIAKGAYSYENYKDFRLTPLLKMGSSYKITGSLKPWASTGIEIDPKPMKGQNVTVHFLYEKMRTEGKSCNEMDLALIHYSKNRDAEPIVQWLKLNRKEETPIAEFDYGTVGTSIDNVKIPSHLDKMIAVVLNRGAAIMSDEVKYASFVDPLEFKIGFEFNADKKDKQASKVAQIAKKSKPTKKKASDIAKAISACMQEAAIAEKAMSTATDEKEINGARLRYDYSLNKAAKYEKQIVSAVKAALAKDDDSDEVSRVTEFLIDLKSKPMEEQQKFSSLLSEITSLLKFEQAQGNKTASKILSNWE